MPKKTLIKQCLIQKYPGLAEKSADRVSGICRRANIKKCANFICIIIVIQAAQTQTNRTTTENKLMLLQLYSVTENTDVELNYVRKEDKLVHADVSAVLTLTLAL